MAPKDLYIELDNPVRSFFPGQQLSGRVIVESRKEKRTEGITVSFLGKATVRWTESHNSTTGSGKNRRNIRRTVVYYADEEYFDCKINLMGNGGYEIIIPAGRHAYPFQFTLPKTLPSSFRGIYGQVGYSVTAIMKRTWKFDHKAFVPFTVNGILDLNREIAAQESVDIRKHKDICCLCCKSGPVGFTFKMPKKGFVPGEGIQITAEFGNQSRRKVNKTTLSLIQETCYHARGKTKVESRVMNKSVGPSIDREESEIWTGKVLQIPPIPPTRLGSCRIIDVSYKLLLEMDLSGLAVNLKAIVPIIIGTIPLRNTFEELSFHVGGGHGNNNQDFSDAAGPSNRQPPPYFDIHSGPGIPSAPAFESYPDLPPPSYSEAVASEKFQQSANTDDGVVNEGFAEGNSSAPPEEDDEYVPNYITYGWTNPQQRQTNPFPPNNDVKN